MWNDYIHKSADVIPFYPKNQQVWAICQDIAVGTWEVLLQNLPHIPKDEKRFYPYPMEKIMKIFSKINRLETKEQEDSLLDVKNSILYYILYFDSNFDPSCMNKMMKFLKDEDLDYLCSISQKIQNKEKLSPEQLDIFYSVRNLLDAPLSLPTFFETVRLSVIHLKREGFHIISSH